MVPAQGGEIGEVNEHFRGHRRGVLTQSDPPPKGSSNLDVKQMGEMQVGVQAKPFPRRGAGAPIAQQRSKDDRRVRHDQGVTRGRTCSGTHWSARTEQWASPLEMNRPVRGPSKTRSTRPGVLAGRFVTRPGERLTPRFVPPTKLTAADEGVGRTARWRDRRRASRRFRSDRSGHPTGGNSSPAGKGWSGLCQAPGLGSPLLFPLRVCAAVRQALRFADSAMKPTPGSDTVSPRVFCEGRASKASRATSVSGRRFTVAAESRPLITTSRSRSAPPRPRRPDGR
jgi:hypothetical protein